MPEFIARGAIPLSLLEEVDEFVNGYLEAAEFTVPDEEIKSLSHCPRPIWSAESVKQAVEDCRRFRMTAPVELEMTDDQAGRCFWLSRGRFGAGFCDHDEYTGYDQLHEYAMTFSECRCEFTGTHLEIGSA